MDKVLRIVAVCGCGMGSSVILRMNAEKLLKEMKVPAKVEVADATSAKGAARGADLIVVSKELAYLFKGSTQPIISLSNFVNTQELKEKLTDYLNSTHPVEG